ncbi:MAG: cell division protein FtsA [Saprospiraceae bacterium]|nr:cell division protein FtsA [Saprospiraceae bacterium]
METNSYYNPEIIAALDIGTTKVSVVVGRKNILNKIEILGYGKVSSEGVIRGVVSNIDKTVKAISDAVDLAEKMSHTEIHKMHVGIAGQHIKSIQHQGLLLRTNYQDEISKEDVQKLIDDMHKIALPPGDQILHVIPQEFTVDQEEGIQDPIGMSGARLQSNFHIITGNTSAAQNIQRCMERAGLESTGMTLEPLASAESVLSKDEKEAGVVMVDIGGGTTDITIYYEGIIRYTSVIPLGSLNITKDIKSGCSTTLEYAEKLKVRFGCALADEIIDNRIITIPGLMGREPKEISEKNLAKIIQARVDEIFDYVMWDIHRSGFENKLAAGIVLTGGGSLLKNIDLLAEYRTGLAARIGLPTMHLSSHYQDEIKNPMFATGVGLLIEGLKKVVPSERVVTRPNPSAVMDLQEDDVPLVEVQEEIIEPKGWFRSVYEKSIHSMKGFFEDHPDREF